MDKNWNKYKHIQRAPLFFSRTHTRTHTLQIEDDVIFVLNKGETSNLYQQAKTEAKQKPTP